MTTLSMLHTLSCSPATNLAALLHYINQDDAIILLQDGVIAGLEGSNGAIQLLASGAALYALNPDLVARGLRQHLAAGITVIDYLQFVALTTEYTPQISWR